MTEILLTELSQPQLSSLVNSFMWATPCENMSLSIYYQGLHCLLKELLDTTECMNGE